MTRNASLEEFAESGEPGESDDPEPVDEAVEPVTATYGWTPDDDATCDRCGAAAGRRWCDGNEFVCVNCKQW